MRERTVEINLTKTEALRLYDTFNRESMPYFNLLDEQGEIRNTTQDYGMIEEHQGKISVEFYVSEPVDTKLYPCSLTHAELEIANMIFGRKVGEIQ